MLIEEDKFAKHGVEKGIEFFKLNLAIVIGINLFESIIAKLFINGYLQLIMIKETYQKRSQFHSVKVTVLVTIKLLKRYFNRLLHNVFI